MKALFTILLIFFAGMFHSASAQDIDLFNKQLNDNFDMPAIHPDMSFQEYQLLSRNLRMKHMLYAMAVPGYVHFYTHEKVLGYGMLGTRLVGYGGLACILANNENIVSIENLLKWQFKQSVFPEGKEKQYTAITTVSLVLIFGSYFFDWIHGQHILQKKQEKIRYQYSPKLSFGLLPAGSVGKANYTASIGFSITFR